MIRIINMRFWRGLFWALIFSLILWALIIAAAKKAWGLSECRYQKLDPGIWTAKEEARTSRCVLKKFGPIPGGYPELMTVGNCESGFNRLAVNQTSSSSYLGLFQHSANYWSGRVRAYEPELWTLNPRWQNSRSQITVTVRMVHSHGWGAWACA
jgi:Transglycosylase-like domain